MSSAAASTRPLTTEAMVASCAPEKATRLKSRSGLSPACSRKLRGIRWPEVLDCEPKLTFLPLRSASVLMPESVWVMNTERNCVSSSRCAIGMILPPERMLRLHEGEAAEPDHVDLLVDQRFDRGRVVGDRRELDLGAELARRGTSRAAPNLRNCSLAASSGMVVTLNTCCAWATPAANDIASAVNAIRRNDGKRNETDTRPPWKLRTR